MSVRPTVVLRMSTSVMACVYLLLLLVGSIVGDLWLRNNTGDEHQFFQNVSSVSNTECSFICQQFQWCSKFGFRDPFCYCLGSSTSYNNTVYLDYYYGRDVSNFPQINQSLYNDLVAKSYTMYDEIKFGLKSNEPHEMKNWEDANNDCISDGGNLYMVNSLIKREILEQFLIDKSNLHVFFIGLKKINGTWMWPDGGKDIFYLENESQDQYCSLFDQSIHNITSAVCANLKHYICEVSYDA